MRTPLQSFETTIEIDVDVSYRFNPEETQTRDQPGCPPGVELERVTISRMTPDGKPVVIDITEYLPGAVLEQLTLDALQDAFDAAEDAEPHP